MCMIIPSESETHHRPLNLQEAVSKEFIFTEFSQTEKQDYHPYMTQHDTHKIQRMN
uniref:Uncharacterized protein n=1 Tax=Astatotilapia calliptera TaxID=8154 RepID=A0AAX7UN89_ASTCA